MAKIAYSVHYIAKAIQRAEKKLRRIRPEVSKADQKKIDLNLRMLRKSYHFLEFPCPKFKSGPIKPFGQWFITKPK
jgi:hypothetical protein